MAEINTAKNGPKKTWRLLNGLTTYKTSINSNVKAIKHKGAELTNPLEIVNTFNNYFRMTGDNLASKISCSDTNPTSYITLVSSAFSFAKINIESVLKVLKSSPDNIPGKVLKMAARILSPSLSV